MNANTSEEDSGNVIVLYKKRWLILLLFSWLSLTNSLNWITFAPIATTVIAEYKVNSIAVNMLSMIYMIVFIPGIFPASYIVDNYSLGSGFRLGAILNTVGAIIRVLPWPFYGITDSAPYSFIPVFIGQTICALAQTFIIAMPSKLAQSWFGESERVTATAIGALANQSGIAVGFFLCPLVVPDGSDESAIVKLLLLLSLFCITSLILILIFFKSKPPTPPSRSEELKCESEENNSVNNSFKVVIPQLLKNFHYVNLCVSFGIVVGSFYAISTLLNQMLFELKYSDSATVLVGTLMVVIGIIGAILFGIVADKTKKYKILLILCIGGTLVSFMYWAFVFREDRLIAISIGSSLLGFFMTALLPISMDTAVEITFPLPEAIVVNILFSAAQVFGILLICICTPLLNYVSIISVNFTLFLTVSLATILILFFNGHHKRGLLEETKPISCNNP